MQVLLEKGLGGLKPANDEAFRIMGYIKSGACVVADIKDPRRRSTYQHNFWFAMISEIFALEAIKKYAGNFENFRDLLLIRLGRCEEFKRPDGSVDRIAKSVAFHKMDPPEFSLLVDDTLAFAETLGFSRDELEQHVNRQVTR